MVSINSTLTGKVQNDLHYGLLKTQKRYKQNTVKFDLHC